MSGSATVLQDVWIALGKSCPVSLWSRVFAETVFCSILLSINAMKLNFICCQFVASSSTLQKYPCSSGCICGVFLHTLTGVVKDIPPSTNLACILRFLPLHCWKIGFGCNPFEETTLTKVSWQWEYTSAMVILYVEESIAGIKLLVWGAEFWDLSLWGAESWHKASIRS